MRFGRLLVRFLTPIFRFMFRVRIIGVENVPQMPGDPPLILCCNHISNWDPAILLITQPRHLYFMAKAELFKVPVVRGFVKMLGAFPVRRGEGDTAAIDHAKKLVAEGKVLGIFPEGTRSRNGKLLRLKSGTSYIAAQTGAYILPAAIVTKKQRYHLFQRVYVTYGTPLSPQELHLDDKGHPDIRFATRFLTDRIETLIREATP